MKSLARRYDEGSLDAKDVRILRIVMNSPQASVEGIAGDCGIPASTAQKRLSFLIHNGFLERVIRIVDWAEVGYPLRFRIDIRVNLWDAARVGGGGRHPTVKPNALRRLALHVSRLAKEEYADTLVVQDVIVLFGHQVDLSVALRAKNHEAVFDFVTARLRELPGVESTETFHEAWSAADGTLR